MAPVLILQFMADDAPAYLFWLRDERDSLAAIVAVVCNRLTSDANVLPFSYVHDHLRPALELLRRDLLARADIEKLNEHLTARDKDLELLLSVTGSHPQASGSDDLQSLLANAAGHLKCVLAGIVVPDKGLTLTWPESGDPTILTRTQKQLLAITQTRRDPLVINRIATQAGQVAIPYRILACPLRQGSGRTSGVLALFRKLDSTEFIGRDVHLADLLARARQPILQPIFDLESPHLVAGRVVLIGDAAFVARPHVATGVTKAALDATCLAEALAAEKTIDEALGRYERERAPAGRRLVARGRYLGAFLEGRDADPMRTPETIIREYGAAGVIQKPGV